MNPARLINQECIITTRTQTGPEDEFGTPTWEDTDTEGVIHIQPAASDEVEDRPAGRFTHRGFLLPDVEIDHTSKVTVGDKQWDVDGPPRMFHNPRLRRDVYQIVDLVGYAVLEDESS